MMMMMTMSSRAGCYKSSGRKGPGPSWLSSSPPDILRSHDAVTSPVDDSMTWMVM